jgi:membrane-bound lytic murein transglycosylase A
MRKRLRPLHALPVALSLIVLAACSSTPFQPAQQRMILREQSRWVLVHWTDLPAWQSDRTREAWPALLRSCERPTPDWTAFCNEARRTNLRTDAEVRAWLEQRLQPYRVESLRGDPAGLATGYFEPLIEARTRPDATCHVPLHARPPDLATRRPYWTRREIETLSAARPSLAGREIAWACDRLDALLLQVQGSGRLSVMDPAGHRRTVRVAYDGDNGQPYRSIGRWLIDQGELRPGQAAWPAIRDWARRHPDRLDELLWANPRYVFFRMEELADAGAGPRGAHGVPLTSGRSIAVDPKSIPYGTLAWRDTTDPATSQPLRRLVLAQDTGSAITGAVRVDYFWGSDDRAASQAGRMRQPLRVWVMWPR